jgi:hypothetical protein
MRRATGRPDYEMPEKSEVLLGYEDEVKAKRDAAAAEAEKAGESSSARIMHSEQDIMNILMQFCVERAGRVIDAGTGADLMKFFIEKSIERDAQMMRAVEREKPDEDPKNMPSSAEVKKQMAEKGQAEVDLGTPSSPSVVDTAVVATEAPSGDVETRIREANYPAAPTESIPCHEHHVIDGTTSDGILSYATTSLV